MADFAGMVVNTEAGSLQLSSEYPNFHLRHKFVINELGAVAWQPPGQQPFTRVVERRFTARAPILATASDYPGKPVSVLLYNEGGDNWLARIYMGLQPTNGVICTVWVYDIGVYHPQGWGLDLFLADGTVAFSTSAMPMRVVQVFPVRQGSVSSSHAVDVPAGRRYASIVCGGR